MIRRAMRHCEGASGTTARNKTRWERHRWIRRYGRGAKQCLGFEFHAYWTASEAQGPFAKPHVLSLDLLMLPSLALWCPSALFPPTRVPSRG